MSYGKASKKIKSHSERVFSHAYDKAARLTPGQASTLNEEEETTLRRAIRKFQERRSQRRGKRSFSIRKSGEL